MKKTYFQGAHFLVEEMCVWVWGNPNNYNMVKSKCSIHKMLCNHSRVSSDGHRGFVNWIILVGEKHV